MLDDHLLPSSAAPTPQGSPAQQSKSLHDRSQQISRKRPTARTLAMHIRIDLVTSWWRLVCFVVYASHGSASSRLNCERRSFTMPANAWILMPKPMRLTAHAATDMRVVYIRGHTTCNIPMAKHMIHTMSIAPATLALDLLVKTVTKRYANECGSYKTAIARACYRRIWKEHSVQIHIIPNECLTGNWKY